MANQGRRLKILILDQGRQSLPFFKALSQSGHIVICVCNTRLNESYFSRYPSKKLIWPSYVTHRKEFEEHLLFYLKNNRIDVVISLGDISAEILSSNKSELIKYTKIINPDYDIFIKAADKLALMNYCVRHNLPCPKTFELTEEILDQIEELLNFPVIVKPTRGVGAVGVGKFYTTDEIRGKLPSLSSMYGKLIVQEFIPQEGGMQYQAEAFLDRDSKMKVCLIVKKPRFFPVNGGTSTANLTVFHPEIFKITRTLLEGLKWQGAADVDYILDPRNNVIKILEINPRVTAGIKIAFVAGIDFADLHLRLALGKDVPLIDSYRTGIYCRNFFLEILWFLFSDRQMGKNSNTPFFKLFGRNMVDQVISFDDPLTGLGFFLNMMRKYTSISNFRAKFHK